MNFSVHSVNTRITTIFIDQMPTFYVFTEVHSTLVSVFSAVYHFVSQVLGRNVTFKVALSRYLNMHSLYSTDEFFY